MHVLLLLRYAMMRTLQELALQAVPFPGKQAEKYLPAHHPIAKELQPLDYKQMRDKFREHRVKFRCVLPYEIFCTYHGWKNYAHPVFIHLFS